ncbi:MAG: hypothetical protein AVDCRST_MAG40-297, partial [uncultured Gemmatimonadaceae bacterium]
EPGPRLRGGGGRRLPRVPRGVPRGGAPRAAPLRRARLGGGARGRARAPRPLRAPRRRRDR